MNRILFAIAAAGVLASGTAFAGSYQSNSNDSGVFVHAQYYGDRHAAYDRYGREGWDRWSISEREQRISARIRHSIDDGTLTPFEARRLYRELGSIKAKERSFRADGRLDRGEREELNRDLDRLAEDVWRERHDQDRRG